MRSTQPKLLSPCLAWGQCGTADFLLWLSSFSPLGHQKTTLLLVFQTFNPAKAFYFSSPESPLTPPIPFCSPTLLSDVLLSFLAFHELPTGQEPFPELGAGRADPTQLTQPRALQGRAPLEKTGMIKYSKKKRENQWQELEQAVGRKSSSDQLSNLQKSLGDMSTQADNQNFKLTFQV